MSNPARLLGPIIVAVLVAGCPTDERMIVRSDRNRPGESGVRSEGVNTVRMVVDSNPPEGMISLNGVNIGYSPREIHLEVDKNGRLAYPVTISVAFSAGAGRMGGVGPRQAQGGTYRYEVGDRVPASLVIVGQSGRMTIKTESRYPAPYDDTPTEPDARVVVPSP